MFAVILLLVVCSVLLYWCLKTNNYWTKRNIIQVDDMMLKFLFSKHSMPEIAKDIYDKHDGRHIGSSLGSKPMLMLKNVEDIQAVLAGDFQSFHSRGLVLNSNDLLADNVLFMNDFQRWKLTRQKLTPVFTSSRLKNMFYIIEKCACDFVTFVEDNPQLRHKPFDMLYTYTTASIGASVFGIDTNTKNTMDSPFMDMSKKSIEPSLFQTVSVFLSDTFPTLFKLLRIRVFGEVEDFFISTVKKVMESRKHDSQKRHDFIEICLELKKQGTMQDLATGYELEPTDELLAAQAFFFFIAGADTSANTMHFTLTELASNPKILTKLHQEIDGILKNESDELTYNDIDKFQYLDKVLNEAMRKYPPIGVIQRLCTKETVLPSGVPIEKDVICMIPVYAMHRDEKIYPNPDLFDPDRFDTDLQSGKGKYSYLPFGEGNRICIGNRFARLQVKAGLARLLRRFTLTPQEYKPITFEKSPFGLRAPDIFYELKPRDV
ncbi:probable cytochrome P450 6a13 [Trichoplusia ni]|uniref:unspecific monooxygenase n=1 Tax=Trichoplusia ni TaxID=7111 RepID=A0A7E5VE30_TRINI|nr:probable cytochrome P450 6a13 [Trichoplusia ni]